MSRVCSADIHTHIIPCMDDGSSSPEESLKLLSELARQGVKTIAATPHFYADKENPERFFTRRDNSFGLIKEQLDSNITVLLGAEVFYYYGISETKELPQFTIGTTNLLLLEMPFCDWTYSIINEVYSIQRDRKLDVIIAHIDRYLTRKNKSFLEDMLDFGIKFQINASAFFDKKRRKDALQLLESKKVHFVASDCHNMISRPPKLSDAFDVIENKLGKEYINWLQYTEKSILNLERDA